MANAQIKLVSSFARFVNGDIKGGAAAHAFRKETIATAIEQAYKGNYSPMEEAATLTQGTAKKARAYAAGFAALGKIGSDDGIKKVHYIGSLSAHENKAAREEILAKTAASVSAFFVAFDAVMAEKAEKKAPKADTAPAGDAAPVATEALTEDQKRHAAAVSLDDEVTNMELRARMGTLTGEQTDRLAAALIDTMSFDQLREIANMVDRQMAASLAAEPIAA